MSSADHHVTPVSGGVRRADVSDLATLVLLNEPVQELHAALYPVDFKKRPEPAAVAKFFEAILGAPQHSVGIFDADNRSIAYIWFEEQHRPATPFTEPYSLLYIHHISVMTTDRERGVGSALLDWAFNHALVADIAQVALDHWAANEAAHRFFTTRGFEDLKIIMRRPA